MTKTPFWYGIYNIVMLAITPLYALRMILKSVSNPSYRDRFSERLGFVPFAIPTSQCILLHAVSLGEAKSVSKLYLQLRLKYPDLPIIFTATTPAGSKYIKNNHKDALHMYLPFDCGFIISRFIKEIRPKLTIIVETEIWPGLFFEAKKNNTKIIVINGRLSDRSFPRYQKFKKFTQDVLSVADAILVQSQEDAKRYIEIGAIEHKVDYPGNIKYDNTYPKEIEEVGLRLKSQLGKKVFFAASTHSKEEEIILSAFKIIKKKHSDAVLFLAPRHIERSKDIAKIIESESFIYKNRSSLELSEISGEFDVLLIDSIGEMGMFFACSDVSFIGGSLVPLGGHNYLEPASLSKPVLTGPQYFNFKDVANRLIQTQALQVVTDVDTMATSVNMLFEDKDAAALMGQRGLEVFKSNQGALDKTISAIEKLI